MGLIIDLAIILIIVLSIFLGYKKGLIGVAFKILSFFIALILAFALYKPVANYIINNTQIDNQISITIEGALGSTNIEEIKANDAQIETNMPEVITDYISAQVKNVAATAQDEIAKVVASNLTTTIINGMSLIGIFIISKILLLFLKIFADAIAKIPIIKQFNKIGGILYGILRGFFMVYLFFAIVSLISPLITHTPLITAIESSFVGNIVYNNNLLIKMFFK